MPVPATVDPSSVAELLYVCDSLLPPVPPAAEVFAILFSDPSPQSTL